MRKDSVLQFIERLQIHSLIELRLDASAILENKWFENNSGVLEFETSEFPHKKARRIEKIISLLF